MSHRILLTGASGYLGGAILARLAEASLPAHDKVYALVRTTEQSEAVRKYGFEPISVQVAAAPALRKAIVDARISIVIFTIDAGSFSSQGHFIDALAEVKDLTGNDVHFIDTSGAKLFSSHSGARTDEELPDDSPAMFELQKAQKPLIRPLQQALDANNKVIEHGEICGVKTYIFVPCIVYGEGTGFGNKISIQTVAIVKAAKALQSVRSVDNGRPTWPVCHLSDTTNLYLGLLAAILAGANPGQGRDGYYLAASGSIPWEDIYTAFAEALAVRGVIHDSNVKLATEEELTTMAKGLGCPKELVSLQLGGSCRLVARNAATLGWLPAHKPEHILEAADAEVELMLKHLA
ncbi:NAD(P)-binding protein [Myriangium duriaei CBS 260.36]|uniref:NAD(P)-binding protein n=1 Tax=Myriangium duriaei CBS 260.36 TaxID=1168546 RepID=A0A9P4ITS9_9PEZI|nr:NAD(P)-binding protein [Myriangium duriaei CBS 260.36]